MRYYTFHVLLIDEDYYDFMLTHQYSMPAYRKKNMAQRYVTPVKLMAYGLILGSRRSTLSPALILGGIISVLWVLLAPQLVKAGLRHTMRLMKKTAKLPLDRDATIAFEEEHYTVTTKDVVRTVRYSAVENIVVGKNALYIYENAMTACILRFSAFASDEEREAFRVFIKEKTNVPETIGRTR